MSDRERSELTDAKTRASSAGIVLVTLAAGQFLMTLDSSVMNVSIATVAKDVGTSVTGIQTAITFYPLVMASLMITGGKVGQILGRKRAFAIGCVIYGCGSFTTAVAPSLAVLVVGWSVLEGVGAALIMPAIVALVASNFARAERPRAYGLVASAGAIAVAAGPLIGGLFTTYLSWRLVFVGEVVVVLVILALTRRMADTPAERGVRLDLVGTGLSAVGLGLVVYGILRSGTWGFVQSKPAAPQLLRMSPNASPRRVVRLGFLALFAGIVVMIAALDAGAGPEIVTWPMLLAGLGVGALASQLGSVTVSSVPDEQSGEVGGLQNTLTNLGASIGTALAGAVLISALSSSFFTGIQNNPKVPENVASKAQVELAAGIPFVSDKDLKTALDKADVPADTADAVVAENETAL